MLEVGQRVRVRAPLRGGVGTVVGVGVRVRVELDSGQVVRVKPEHVRPLVPPPRTKTQRLERAPAYDAAGSSAVPKTKLNRAPRYLRWIREQACEWCGAAAPSEASHHAEDGHGSTALKADDLDTLPLCHGCHAEWHRCGTLGQMTGEQARQWAQIRIKRTLRRFVTTVLVPRWSAA